MTPRDFFILAVGAAITAAIQQFVSAFARRGDEQRAALSAQNEERRIETGKRIGAVEKWIDQEIGRQRGLREARRRGGDGR